METNELIDIWKTLAENKLIGANLAKEHIYQLITKKGAGFLEKLIRHIKKEIITDVITSGIVVLIILGVFIFQSTFPVEKKAYIFLFVILLYFIFKLYRDIRKLRMLKVTRMTDSVKAATLNSYSRFKSQIRQDLILAISFLVCANLYAIYVYVKAFGDYKHIDFSSVNVQSIGFVLLLIMVVFVFIAPWIIKRFFTRKYQTVIDNFETTLKELNNVAE